MNDLVKAYNILGDITGTTNSLDYPAFGGLWCMVIEEYCRTNGLDILEVSKTMCNMISEVNQDLGTYR